MLGRLGVILLRVAAKTAAPVGALWKSGAFRKQALWSLVKGGVKTVVSYEIVDYLLDQISSGGSESRPGPRPEAELRAELLAMGMDPDRPVSDVHPDEVANALERFGRANNKPEYITVAGLLRESTKEEFSATGLTVTPAPTSNHDHSDLLELIPLLQSLASFWGVSVPLVVTMTKNLKAILNADPTDLETVATLSARV